MNRPEQPSQPVNLPKAYWHWVEVVDRFLLRDRNRRSIQAEDYQRIHRDLLSACQAVIRNGGVEAGRADRLHVLARPWLNTDLLEQADASMLQMLLRDCQHIEKEMGWRRDVGKSRVPILGLGLLLVGGTLAGLAWVERERLLPRLMQAWRPLRILLGGLSLELWLLVGGLVAALIGFLIVWRGRRLDR